MEDCQGTELSVQNLAFLRPVSSPHRNNANFCKGKPSTRPYHLPVPHTLIICTTGLRPTLSPPFPSYVAPPCPGFLRPSFSSGMCHLSFVLRIFVDVAPSGWNSSPSSQPLEPNRASLSIPSQPSAVRERGFYSSYRCRMWLAGGPFISFQWFCSSKLCS